MESESSILNVSIIGFGNVGRHLAYAILDCEKINLVEIFNRTGIDSKLPFHFVHEVKYLKKDSDLYILCISDDYIEEVAQLIHEQIDSSSIIVHTSGLKKLDFVASRNRGVLYPLNTFSTSSDTEISTTPIIVQASNNESRDKILHVARSLSSKVFELHDKEREIVHLAAVISNNFSNVLIQEAQQLLIDKYLPIEIIYPLLKTQNRLLGKHLAKDIQSGPAKRNDQKTMSRHIELLEDKKDLQKLYITLSQLITKNQN